jgi:hypothetical protein
MACTHPRIDDSKKKYNKSQKTWPDLRISAISDVIFACFFTLKGEIQDYYNVVGYRIFIRP